MSAGQLSITLFSPAGVVPNGKSLRLAARRLTAQGCVVQLDASALAKHQRFAGDDDTRMAAFQRVARDGSAIALAARGGYGMMRLLDRLDYPALAKSGKTWVGHSDFTAFQLAMLARTGTVTYAGPMACGDFGGESVDEVTQDCFLEAMHGELEAVGFRTDPGFDGLHVKGTLWGGNLCMVTSLLGTPYFPQIRGGLLFLEDVNEHPYMIERRLMQLHHAGVLARQKAIVLGRFTEFTPSPLDRGYNLKAVVGHLRALTKTPVLTGLPFGHVPTKVTLPVGAKADLLVEGRDALIVWG